MNTDSGTRSYKREAFVTKLKGINWSIIYTLPDVNSILNWMVAKVVECLDEVAPIQTTNIPKKNNEDRKPWMTDEIRKLSIQKRTAWRNFITIRDDNSHTIYKVLNKKVKEVSLVAKNEFLREEYSELGDSKKSGNSSTIHSSERDEAK